MYTVLVWFWATLCIVYVYGEERGAHPCSVCTCVCSCVYIHACMCICVYLCTLVCLVQLPRSYLFRVAIPNLLCAVHRGGKQHVTKL